MDLPPLPTNPISHFLTLPSRLTKFTWKYIVDKHPYSEISLEDFKRVACASEGWRFVERLDYKYNILTGFSNVDEFVKEALYFHDEQLYEDLKGYTKVPRIGRAYHSLLKYAGPTIYKSNVFDDRMRAIYDHNLMELEGSFNTVGIFDVAQAVLKIPLNTSAGISFPGKKKGEVLQEAHDKVQWMIGEWKAGRVVKQVPCKLALRGHLSEVDKNKTRCVWVSPVEHTILENMFFRGFYYQIFAGLHHQRRYMTGKDTIFRLNNYLSEDTGSSFVNTDISGWDSLRCRFVLQDIFHRVLKPNIRMTEDWHESAFDYLVDAFIFTHLCLPDGTVFKKIGGVPSGSFLTLLVNSMAVWNTCSAAAKYVDIPFYDERVLGDDFCYKTDHMEQDQLELSVHDLSECVFTFFGLVIKPEKVVATNVLNDRKFIGYQVRNGRLFREDRELLLGMLHPESPVKTIDVSFTRVFSFMILGGFGSSVVSRFYERFLGGYKVQLDRLGPDLFRQDVLKHGNLRVFKHVFKVDLEQFDGFDIDSFRELFSSKVPFFLTFGARFLLET